MDEFTDNVGMKNYLKYVNFGFKKKVTHNLLQQAEFSSKTTINIEKKSYIISNRQLKKRIKQN